jgi:carboxynorspermidine decarboxylase
MKPAIPCHLLTSPDLASPAFVVDEAALRRNAKILAEVRDAAACQLVLALKGFSLWHTFPLLRDYLDGCCASGVWEAKLAKEEFGKHVLTYSPAYTTDDIDELLEITDHLDFNTPAQWLTHRDRVMAHPRYQSGALQAGLRINPECSTGHTAMYDPCAVGSRLGSTAAMLEGADLTGISGLHFHTLCEQDSGDLATTLEAVEEKFGALLRSPAIRYLNMGGGHWITKPWYDRERLVALVKEAAERYQVQVWLEPGEAVAIHTGVLVATVLDVFITAGIPVAILDISATNHMPDVLEMPYRPDVFLAAEGWEAMEPGREIPESWPTGAEPCLYRLGAPTCLAGDVIGDYAFPRPLVPGDRLVFDDMTHYTMVKTTFFNGIRHPDIVLMRENGAFELLRRFGYEDFRNRLG